MEIEKVVFLEYFSLEANKKSLGDAVKCIFTRKALIPTCTYFFEGHNFKDDASNRKTMMHPH